MTPEEKMDAIYHNIIRPEMRDSWSKSYRNWFVTSDRAEDIRKPGLFKTEFEFTRGRFIGLMPKTYIGMKN